MNTRFLIPAALVTLALALAVGASAGTGSGKDANRDSATSSSTSATHTAQDDAARLDGEKRFHANCGRCHTAPPKFSPRMVATIVRHMRVRATLTDEDTRFIIHYMLE